MALVTRKTLISLSLLGGGALAVGAGSIWFGIYNIAADDPHTRPVYAVLETLRNRSIEVRASKLQAPDLSDPARIKQGAGNYNAMCTGCHLAPGMPETELSKGLYPTPPNLSITKVDAAKVFWTVKHGIKASGMPAWGKSMNDEYIWNMAAFIQILPTLNADKYKELVASSGGHSHGGGESKPHDAMPGMKGMEGMDHDAEEAVDESKPHGHEAGAGHDEAKPAVDESKPHGHEAGAGHDEAKPAAKPPVDESKSHDHPPGSEH